MTDHSVCFDFDGWLAKFHTAETGEASGWRRTDDGTPVFVGDPLHFIAGVKRWVSGALSADRMRWEDHTRHGAEVASLQAEVLALAEQKEALASECEQERRRADGEENRAEVLRIALIDIANGADGIIVAKRVLTSDCPGLLAKYIDILQERLAKHSAALANAEKRIERLTYLTTDEDCYCMWCGSKRFNGHRDNCIAAEEE